MPELPDLEILKENIIKKLKDKKIVYIQARRSQAELRGKLVGKKLKRIYRRGKLLFFEINGQNLVVHLMLAGRIYYKSQDDKIEKITMLLLRFDNGFDLRFEDRRFWTKFWLNGNEKTEKLGVEPLSKDFTLEFFRNKLSKSRTKIKPLLMKQEFIAGIGNAYSDEILFDAKIHPEKQANKLSEEEIENLYQSIKKILQWGIEEIKKAIGSQILEDENRKFMKVYRKEGEKCFRCKSRIKMIRVGGRDTFYCVRCQKI